MKIPKRRFLILATFLLALLLYVDRVCISTAKGPITAELGLSDKQFGWVLSAFALGYALCQTPSGMLADRFGPRRILSAVVVLWSLFTGLSGAIRGFASLLMVRFLFGAGEAGAFPGMARAIFSWIPMKERGLAQGINFSGGRLGAAFALPAVAWMVERFGWRMTFAILMLVGFAWALGWYAWFRDDPAEHPGITPEEKEYILAQRQPTTSTPGKLPFRVMMASPNMWYAMVQYFCSNFTFFFCLSWLFPYLKKTYELEAVEAGWYAAIPLIGGAVGNITAGWLVDWIYRRNQWKLSRQVPAILGFALAAVGLVMSVYMDTVLGAVTWLTIAILGADMTLAPSWSFCIDIGRRHSGAVSGTMNMAGNIGSFVTSLAFPYLMAWTGDPKVFFFAGAVLNVIAIGMWMRVRPDQPLQEIHLKSP